MTDSQILLPIMTVKGHEIDDALQIDVSIDNENYNGGDSCENLDEDNISFASNDLPQNVHQQQGHEHEISLDQHSCNSVKQRNSPHILGHFIDNNNNNKRDENGSETHYSDEILSNVNEMKADTMEEIKKEDISVNTYGVNSKQQFSKEIHSVKCHQPLTTSNKLSSGSVSANAFANTTTKACAKKSFVWKYFHHPEIKHGIPDRSRTQCILCDSQLAFNASGTTTTMLNHLKSRHGEIAEKEETMRRFNRDSRKNHLRNMILTSSDCKSSPTNLIGNNTMLKNGEMMNAISENMQVTRNLSTSLMNGSSSNNNNKYNRGTLSIGQRGRPPGSGRRQKSVLCPKVNDNLDFLAQDTISNGCMKSDGNTVYPISTYPTTLSDQQKAFLNEMLLSAAAAASASTISASKGDIRLNGSFTSQTSSPSATSTSPFFASPTLMTQLPNDSNSTKLPFSLMNNVTGLSNIPFQLPINAPHINSSAGVIAPVATTLAIHEISPSSSSGLGLSSVNSPFEVSTNAVCSLASAMLSSSSSSSPTNSLGYRSITSPNGCGGQSNANIRNNILSNMRTIHKTQEFTQLHKNNIIMSGQSSNLTDQCNTVSHDMMDLPLNMQNLAQDKEKFLNLSNENNENIFNSTQLNKTTNSSCTLSTKGISPNSINSLSMLNCPSDMMMSALGNFVNFMPSVNNLLNETTTNNFTNSSINDRIAINRPDGINHSTHPSSQLPETLIQSMPPQQQHQHNQQLLMANAWLASLANGKFPNYSNNFIDPCVMFNLLNLNSNTMDSGLNKLAGISSNIAPKVSSHCPESLKTKTSTSLNLPTNSVNNENNLAYPMNCLLMNSQNKGIDEAVAMNWPNINNSMSLINPHNLKVNDGNNNGMAMPITSSFDNFSSPFQLNNTDESSTGMNLISNQQILCNRTTQDERNNAFFSSSALSSVDSNVVGSYAAMSRLSHNGNISDNRNSNSCSINSNDSNVSYLLPNLNYPSMEQNKFPYMGTLPIMMNGINKELQIKNQEITDASLDLSKTSTSLNNNVDNNGIKIITSPSNDNNNSTNYSNNNSSDDFTLGLTNRNMKINDTNCVLDMRQINNHHKFSSAEHQNINSPLLYSSSNHTVSTKRKRSRPVYISPEKEIKCSSTDYVHLLEGEDMRIERYHTEAVTDSAVNNTNKHNDICIKDKRSCWGIKCNLLNMHEHDIEEHDSDEDQRMTINQSSSSSSSTSLTINTVKQSKSSIDVTRNQLSYHVAQYLIKDLKPPETIEGEGFRNLLSLFTNHNLPTVKEISEITFPDLYTKIEDNLNELLSNRTVQFNSCNPMVSFTIELWNTINDSSNEICKECFVGESKQQFANIGVHYVTGQPTVMYNYLYKSLQNPDCTNLSEALDNCRECVFSRITLTTSEDVSEISSVPSQVNKTTSSFETKSSPISDANNRILERSQALIKVMKWPVSVITNHAESLRKLIDETESNIIILPCLVSELSKALLVGLNTERFRNFIMNLLKEYHCRIEKEKTEHSIDKCSIDEINKSQCCKAVYDLLKWYLNEQSFSNGDKNSHDVITDNDDKKKKKGEIDMETIKGIISVLEVSRFIFNHFFLLLSFPS
ncbi:BED zinc finger isoform 2 [Schistosoma japonicum]|uniref:BED zinc finger isoform 2 n=1 Tax=Schistosoma japonicum TaxID=6182 RepID=A0A4Z2D0U4_SCHJA|nr:BED zinc finger isoform 2 [Schistosoma japonicum]